MYEPLAIVGTACRLPGGANTPSKLWDLLKAPRDVLKEFSSERLRFSGFYNKNGDMRGRSHVLNKSYLMEEDVRHFDNAFFHINPKDAADMDPQQRFLLETVYEAFESAGWSLSDVDGSRTSVHVGVMTDDYSFIQSRDPDTVGGHAATGISRSILANRISYAFNLTGASLALDTACSSSLVALHLAAQGLQRGESTAAVVAGTNLLMDSTWYVMGSSMHMISPESRCRMWDKDASGYARGEGCAAVVLKTLSQAIRDGDRIECIIRGTGVNSDGLAHGSGITIPDPRAQTNLIKETYRNAGLDPVKDRCQYFECHGTGTQAGDPAEAEAIQEAFRHPDGSSNKDVLWCGSIKTVIGHLEGCAGIAGLIKASLSIQHKSIFPNMHFNQLNPKIEPFYGGLQVPTSLLPWPETGGGPRRVSVNSFGFGGTNAHCILESYESSESEILPDGAALETANTVLGDQDVAERRPAGPFVFSAKSRSSLTNWLKQLLHYLRVNESLDLDTLSNTLHSKRSVFRYRTAISTAVDREELIEKLEDQINIINTTNNGSLGSSGSTPGEGASLLGVFTGQGAQAAQMGHALLKYSQCFRESIAECEQALESIPDAPMWSLREELAADYADTRVSEAQFSQPLCTAVQIGLVDLLRVVGVRFRAVVGHSSGEIGAAYAAGFLTKRDAMVIAYYRGSVSHLAQGAAGQRGGMMAVSMSYEAATELCSRPPFVGRVTVAASNSPSSVTLSGDKDALSEMKDYLDEHDVTARALQVDTAYHSHHMQACAEPYSLRLKEAGVTVQNPQDGQACHWYSSVKSDTDISENPFGSGLENQYWVENLTHPVLFSEAVRSAIQGGAVVFTAALEVGPHAALKGPFNQTFKQAVAADQSIPYTSCLTRGKNAIETFSEALTTVWILAPSCVQFAGWRIGFSLPASQPPLEGLPPYAWDHIQPHWRESRVARNYRLAAHPPHDLLGRQWNDSGTEQTWRNTLRLSEMPWIRGHVFQGQVLFPATGYISLAIDAAKALVKNQPIRLLEVHDLSIPKALPVGESDEVEMLFTIRSRRTSPETAAVQSGSVMEAEFTCHSYPHDSDEADKTCEGLLTIHLGEPDETDLAPTYISDVELTQANVDRFYRSAAEIGFAYDGPFRALDSLQKVWGHAKAVAKWSKEDPDMDVTCTLHPAILDNAFQTGLATILSAAEKSMHSPYLPIGFKRAVIDPNQDFHASVTIEAYMTSPTVGIASEILTDINVKTSSHSGHVCGIQLEGVTFKAISEPQPSEDRNILAKTVWSHDAAYGLVPPVPKIIARRPSKYTAEEYERVALFYLRRLRRSIGAQELDTLQRHHQKLLESIDTLMTRIHEDTGLAFLQAEWLNDRPETMANLLNRDPEDAEMALIISSTERTLALLKGRSFGDREHVRYQQSSSAAICNQGVAEMVAQISHTFPRTNILHLCGGVIESAYSVLDAVGDAYGSYTCADVSQDIVNELRDKIGLTAAREKRVSFEVFNTEPRTTTKELYDVIIVSDTCHSRQDLAKSIRAFRSLLRPGGYLILTELTGTSLRPMAILGSSQSWWENMPGISTGEWDNLLSEGGFSDIEGVVYDQSKPSMHGYSVFSAQALDERLEVLRNPLSCLRTITPTSVVIIDGSTSQVSRMIRQAKNLLRGWAHEVQVWSRFDQVDLSALPSRYSVISLQDLDRPLFSRPPSVSEIKNLHGILETAQNILWVTSGRLVEDPYANIMVGIGRALRHEHIDLNLQFLDFDLGETWDVQKILTVFLRLIFTSSASNVIDGLLWVQEPELVLRNSHLVTPRVVTAPEINEVYNAGRRHVVKPVGPTVPIEIVRETVAGSSETRLVCSHLLDKPQDTLQVEVKLSVALHTDGDPPCYLSYGKTKNDTGERLVLALSRTDASTITGPTDSEIHSQTMRNLNATSLAEVASILIASHLSPRLSESGTTLIHGASENLATVIAALAAEAGRKTVFVAISKDPREKKVPGWIYLHPQISTRALRKLIPQDATALYDLSRSGEAAFILSCLPPVSTVQALDLSCLSQQSIHDAVDIYEKHQDIFVNSESTPTVLSLEDQSQGRVEKAERLTMVTDWNRENLSLHASIRPLEPRNLISPNKTYFLVGMAGELGQSLSYFLIRGGARYIVLSSRNPKDNQRWMQDLRANGIDIRMVKMDVTDRAQVFETVSMLRKTMPEIGGVTNAALVLEPAVFANLSAASIAKQMMPKIHGTVHLDEAFKDDPLDFFMCFGSLGTTFGNPGHAIYHAGNAFMMSMVANRKRRGLVGSILNFGMLVDVGYVARADRDSGTNDVEEFLRGDGLIALSEADFFHVILEGITVGKPDHPINEVIMGADMYHDNGQGPKPRWLGTATLSHMVRRVDETASSDAASTDSAQSTLDKAITIEDAIPAVGKLLSQKIHAMIHVSLDSIHPDEPLSRLGIDSINAIEIRKWLLEKLKAEISMVKILGRDSSASIIRDVAEQYMARRPSITDSSTNTVLSTVERELQPVTAQVNGVPAEHQAPSAANTSSRTSVTGHETSSTSTGGSPASTSATSTPDLRPVGQKIIRSEPLSVAQKGLFYIYQFSDKRTTMNLTTKWKIDGPLDVDRLEQAFEKTINRHEALRTCFYATSDNSEIQQHVTDLKPFQLTRLQSTPETAGSDVTKACDRLKNHDYSLETGDTLRATVIRHDTQSYTLLLGIQNIVIDVVSVSIILRDVAREYQARPWSQQPAAPTSYLDYTRQEMLDIEGGHFKDDLEFWRKHLDPLPDVLPLLPVAKVRSRQSSRSYGFHFSEKELSSQFVQSISKISQTNGVTPMQFYLAALQVFLCRILSIDDLVIGITHTGRDPVNKYWATVGHLATILPVRFKGALGRSFPELMKTTQTTLLSTMDHALIPFAHLVNKIRPRASEGNMPLIQVSYTYTVDDSLPSTLEDCSLTLEEADHTTVYDFVVEVRESASGGHLLGFKTSDDYYSSEATAFITETFVGILEGLVQNPLVAVKDCKLFSDTQLDRAKSLARAPTLKHSWPSTLPERFSQVVADFPKSIAIKDGGEAITYGQLDQKVDLYARILLDAGVTAGTRVAVYCKPSIDLYTTMLAIWKIGAVSIPLDVSIPATRRNGIIKAGQLQVLVFHEATAQAVAESHTDSEIQIKLLDITGSARTPRKSPHATEPNHIPVTPGTVSHMLFTSGSTGVPKGITLHQRGIMNFVASGKKRYGFGQIRVLQQTSVGFDVAFAQIFSAFANGGTLVVAPYESRGDPDAISRLMLDEKIQFTMCTPSEYSLLLAFQSDRLRQCVEWHYALAGGEVLPQRVIAGLRELSLPRLLLTNWYGPTEVTAATSHDIPLDQLDKDGDKDTVGSLIGDAIPNSAIYITDDDGSLLPPGMPGEISITGTMVANGYLDTAMNVDTFVTNPFATPRDIAEGHGIMYKTGDRGIMRPDGSVLFLGRTVRGSSTIKLRGLRIDLEEVRGAVLSAGAEDLADAAVTVRGDPEFLVAHVAFKPGRHLEHGQLVALSQKLTLPCYMIPAAVVALDRLPLVPNGKLDLQLLKTLPLPSMSIRAEVEPQTTGSEVLTATEEKLRELWINVVGAAARAAEIGPRSSFFAVGGSSFLLVHLQHAIVRAMGVKIPLSSVFQAVELREMAALIERHKTEPKRTE